MDRKPGVDPKLYKGMFWGLIISVFLFWIPFFYFINRWWG